MLLLEGIIKMTLNCRKIDSNGLVDFAVFAYIFSVFLADGTIVFDAAFVLLLFKDKKIVVNWFCILIALFILFNFFMTFSGITVFPAVSRRRLRSVLLNFISDMIIFSYAKEQRNRQRIYKISMCCAVVLIVYILLHNYQNLFSMRFGRKTPYLFGLRGTNGQYYNSNGVSYILNMAFAYCMLWLLKTKEQGNDRIKTRRIIFIAFCIAFFTVLTGSRKGILTLAVFLAVSSLLRNRSLEGKMKSILAIGGVVIIVYFLIMNVDALYNIVGKRMEVLINGVFSDEGFKTRTSAYYRARMISIGIDLFKQRPLVGWGLDSFSQLSPYATYSHNNYIELLVSGGIIGFGLYYGATVYVLLASGKFLKYREMRNECIVLLSFAITTLLFQVGHVVYVNRTSLLFDFIFASALIDWNRRLRNRRAFGKFDNGSAGC